nr:MAG TPA: hypothetical protein [Caudoviricetes sp.]
MFSTHNTSKHTLHPFRSIPTQLHNKKSPSNSTLHTITQGSLQYIRLLTCRIYHYIYTTNPLYH